MDSLPVLCYSLVDLESYANAQPKAYPTRQTNITLQKCNFNVI